MANLNTMITKLNSGYENVTNLIENRYNFGDEPNYYTTPDITDFDYFGFADVVFIQSDGKIVVGGQSGLYDGILGNYSVLKRFNANGTLDETFTSPKFCYNYDGYIRDVGQQSDGKLIVVGHFTGVDGEAKNRIVRLNTDGSIDNTFTIGSGFNNQAFVCKVLGDDSILVGGNFNAYDGTGGSNLLKLNSDGTIDNTFAGNVSLNSRVHAIAVDGSGKIYAGGQFSNRIIKLNADGTTDGSFDPGTGFDDRVTAIKIQNDGKLIVGGWFVTYNGSSCNPGIVRLETSGAVDGTFASEGSGIEEWDGLSVQSLAIQSNGKIVAVGWFVVYNGTLQRGIIRLNTDGTRDTSLVTGLGFSDRAQDVKIDASGNIFVAGFFYYYNGSPTTTEFNYLTSGQPGCVVKLDSNGTMLGNPAKQDIMPVGIDDGNRDMFDGGLYINTDLNQPYGSINESDSLPCTHSVLFFSDASEGIDWAMYNPVMDNYNWVPTVFDGDAKASDSVFGLGSTYFTNQYPGLFVMGANNISINELSLTGGIGKDGQGDYNEGKFDIVVYNNTYGVFYKTTYGNIDYQDESTNIDAGGSTTSIFNPLEYIPIIAGTITGTIYNDDIAVQTFAVDSNGSFEFTPISSPSVYATSGSVDLDTGILTLNWNDVTAANYCEINYGNGNYETNVQQIIIVDKSSNDITQNLYNPLDSMNQVLTDLSGAKKAFILVFAVNNIMEALTEETINAIATEFLMVLLEQTPTVCTPNFCDLGGLTCQGTMSCSCAVPTLFAPGCSISQARAGTCSTANTAYLPAITVCRQKLY